MRIGVAIVSALLVLSCTHEAPPPVLEAPPEDLSHWSVPEIVEAPAFADVHGEVKEAERAPTPSEKVVEFQAGTPVQVQVPTGWPVDIVLERGEEVYNIVGGDRQDTTAAPPPKEGEATASVQVVRRWEVREGKSGTGDGVRGHIFLAASEAGLHTGVIITTNKRTYYLECKSVKVSPVRVLRWTYPGEHAPTPVKKREPGLLPDPAETRHYHAGYAVEAHGKAPDWAPRQVIDDGKKLYIVFPEVTLFSVMPVIRAIGPQGPAVINARQFLNVVIVDQLLGQAELRVGIGEKAETVTIVRKGLHTITCPGSQECPVWPDAARELALRRQP